MDIRLILNIWLSEYWFLSFLYQDTESDHFYHLPDSRSSPPLLGQLLCLHASTFTPRGVYSPRSSLCGPSETEVRARHSLAWSFRHQLTLNSGFFLLDTGSLFPLWFQSVTFLLAHGTLFTFASLAFLENTKHMSVSWPLYLLSPSA